MLTWVRVPFIRITLLFGAGIILYDKWPAFLWPAVLLLPLALMVLVLMYRRLEAIELIRLNYQIGILYSLILLSTGIIACKLHHHQQPGWIDLTEVNAYEVSICDDPSIRDDKVRVKARIIHTTLGKPVPGKMWLTIKNPVNEYRYGDRLFIKGHPFTIDPPANEYEFDYHLYSKRLGVLYQHAVNEEDLVKTESGSGNPILAWAYTVRSQLKSTIMTHVENQVNQQILISLFLGKKDELDQDVKLQFSDAGVLHVLAVSGLHVGIVYLLLKMILSLFGNSLKSRMIKYTVYLAGIWAYAFITGLPVSVIRAAVMLSLYIISKFIDRSTYGLNSVAVAAFLMLIFDSSLIYNVGFQLSFSAVAGIIFFTPYLQERFEHNNRIVQYIRDIVIISIVVQVATLPFILYHFHTTQIYTPLSNIIVIPIAFVSMLLSMLLVIFSKLEVVAHLIGELLNHLMGFLHSFIQKMAVLPGGLHTNIYFDEWQAVAGVLLVVALAFVFSTRKKGSYAVSIILAFILFSYSGYVSILHHRQRLLVISNTNLLQDVMYFSGPKAYYYQSDSVRDVLGAHFGIKENLAMDSTLLPFKKFSDNGLFQIDKQLVAVKKPNGMELTGDYTIYMPANESYSYSDDEENAIRVARPGVEHEAVVKKGEIMVIDLRK